VVIIVHYRKHKLGPVQDMENVGAVKVLIHPS